MNKISKEGRSRIMRAISSKNTKPEMFVRKWLHSKGFRYRIHKKTLPGTPDIVLKKFNTCIQVRGCFWHQHGCGQSQLPKSNTKYWHSKLKKNKKRDQFTDEEIRSLGYNLIIVWECELGDPEAAESRLRAVERSLRGQTHS